MPRTRTKEKLTVTVDKTVISEIGRIKETTKYSNFSSITNEILRQGLAANGIILES